MRQHFKQQKKKTELDFIKIKTSVLHWTASKKERKKERKDNQQNGIKYLQIMYLIEICIYNI